MSCRRGAYARAYAKVKAFAPKYGETTDFTCATADFAIGISESFKRYRSSPLHEREGIKCRGLASPCVCGGVFATQIFKKLNRKLSANLSVGIALFCRLAFIELLLAADDRNLNLDLRSFTIHRNRHYCQTLFRLECCEFGDL